jgi:hypothetical protein
LVPGSFELQIADCRLQIERHLVILSLAQWLDEDIDHAAAGQADIPGVVVGDAEVQQTRPRYSRR